MGRRVALDSSALIALSRGDAHLRALLTIASSDGGTFVVPAPTLAEVFRGKQSDASIARVLKAIGSELPTSPEAARNAGKTLGAARAPAALTLDALIVETALEHRADAIVTQDAGDFERLSRGRIRVIAASP